MIPALRSLRSAALSSSSPSVFLIVVDIRRLSFFFISIHFLCLHLNLRLRCLSFCVSFSIFVSIYVHHRLHRASPPPQAMLPPNPSSSSPPPISFSHCLRLSQLSFSISPVVFDLLPKPLSSPFFPQKPRSLDLPTIVFDLNLPLSSICGPNPYHLLSSLRNPSRRISLSSSSISPAIVFELLSICFALHHCVVSSDLLCEW
ncbi:hypothetical protein ACLOJK_040897 [Asimina triloba]